MNGEKSTSQQFLSQQFTADFLALLSNSPERRIESSDLPFSSYSGSVSEFSGKILTPLRKAYKDLTGFELPLECSGSGAFSVRMRNERPYGGLFVIGKLSGAEG